LDGLAHPLDLDPSYLHYHGDGWPIRRGFDGWGFMLVVSRDFPHPKLCNPLFVHHYAQM